MIDGLSLLYSCFNQYVFQEAKNNIRDLEYWFSTNPSTCGNILVANLIDAIKKYDLESIGQPLFQSILVRSGKNEQESNYIFNEIVKSKMLSQEQVAPTKRLIKDIVATNYIAKAKRLYDSYPTEYIKYIKELNFDTTDGVNLYSESMDKIDINSIIASNLVGGISSNYSWINEAFLPEKCYPSWGLMMISMPPGTGKSLFAMSEALRMAISGKKVHYLALGDLTMLDFILRLGAIYYGRPFYEVKENLVAVYNGLKDVIKDNLEITILPASSITVDEYIQFIRNKPFKVCFIDYDSNFKSNVMSESMYLVYGDIYAKLSELTIKYNKLVFILAQPGKAAWKIDSYSAIEFDQVGESARKIHAVDFCLTRSREAGNLNGLGISKIVKNRRGEENIIDYNIRLNNGRFKSLPRQVYMQLNEIKDKRSFSEKEIDFMISQYIQTLNANNNSKNNVTNSVGFNEFIKNNIGSMGSALTNSGTV